MKRRHLPLFLLPLLLLGCSESAGPESLCIAVVNVDGVNFRQIDVPSPVEDDLSDEPYLTITRNTGCLDQGEPDSELAHGESNYLAVGTELFEIDGFAPSERLAYWADLIEEWRVLGPES